jgi:DNA-binding XRE family transcriptional regulator
MPAARGKRTKVRTKLAEVRIECGVSQEEMAMLTGMPIATYRRLERGQSENPTIGQLVNCGHVLDWPSRELVEEDSVDWWPTKSAPDPPSDPQLWWHAPGATRAHLRTQTRRPPAL